MTKQADKPKSNEELQNEIEKFKSLLEEERCQHQEAKETLEAIRTGAVDGIVRSSPEGEQVFILKGADQPYRNLIEEMSEGALLISESGTILYANFGFAGLVDAPLDKVIGTHVSDWVSARSIEVLNDIISGNRKNGRRVFEIAFQTTKKKHIPTQVSLSNILFGTVNASALVVTDLTKHMEGEVKLYTSNLEKEITQRKKAEEAIQSSEKQKNDILESITDGFVAFDKEWRYTYVNSNAARILHKPKEELIGKVGIDAFPNASKFLTEFKKAVSSGRPVHFEEYYPEPLNIWYECHCYPSQEGLTVFFSDITQRKKAEEALKQSQELISKQLEEIKSYYDNAPVGLAILDRDLRYIRVNNRFAEMDGMPAEGHIGKTVREVVPALAEQAEELPHKIIRSGEAVRNIEFIGETAVCPGEKRTWLESWIPIKDSLGKVTALYVMGEDITQRKKAEEALQKSETRLRLIAQAGRIGFFEYNASKDISYWSPEHYELLGYEQGLVISWERWLEGVHPEDRARVMANYARLMEQGRLEGHIAGHKNEYRYIRPDGCIVWIESDLSLSMVDNEAIIRGSIRDITERKKAEEAVKESENLYRTIFENSEDGFQLVKPIFDENGNPIDYLFLKVNHAYERQVGLKAEQVVGKTVRQIVPNIEPEWIETHGQVAKTGKTLHKEIYNDFSKRWYDLYYFSYKGGQVGVLFREITARKELEKLVQDNERLAAIGQTAGMVGHDIRNPLQAITSDTYLAKMDLASTPDSEEKKNALESLDEIEKNVVYINKIVQDLQDFAKPLKPNTEETDLKRIIDDLLEKNGLPENVEVSVNTETEKVIADSTFISRIMYNLVNNAVQAMPNGGKLSIRTYKQSNDTIIVVKDTGVGIPEENKRKLFTPLFTTKSKGQGFGLAVIKRMTESLGGTVTFESQEGKGTTFTLRLPPPKS
jgi:PAS domain S-box-containing protein